MSMLDDFVDNLGETYGESRLSDDAQGICDANSDAIMCTKVCPLNDACRSRPGDNHAAWNLRMNRAASRLRADEDRG